jgi:SAM-dependent methyltransferase
MTEGVAEARITLGPLGPGFILDLCAGGEGVIARAYPGRVLGVDQQLSEIKEARARAPADAVFLLGDATRTPFVDNTFPYVTAFFGLLYVKGDEAKRALFAEAARVLRPGGHFLVWDAAVAAAADLVAVQVRVLLPGGDVVRAGYGCRGSTGEMNLDRLNDLAKEAGLHVAAAEDHGAWFAADFESPLTA